MEVLTLLGEQLRKSHHLHLLLNDKIATNNNEQFGKWIIHAI
nr:MAG TPA: hypothetical protein [Caudoviricetes sp.]